jgi:ribosomal protein S18 acetylase RimI-like enzyme
MLHRVEIRACGPDDEHRVFAASHLFDGPAVEAATHRFLTEEGHHLLIAYEEDHPAGFVSGVEVTHPDKGTEMFLYELSVEEPFRRRGTGHALVEQLKAIATERGCYGMWVLTDDTNAPALGAYEAAGGVRETAPRMLTWTF